MDRAGYCTEKNHLCDLYSNHVKDLGLCPGYAFEDGHRNVARKNTMIDCISKTIFHFGLPCL